MKILVANWKMNFKLPEAVEYAANLEARIKPPEDVEVVIAPSNLFIYPLSQALRSGKIQLSAQNLSAPEFGAFTGETSSAQLAGFVKYSIIGHSERRQLFGEMDEDIAEKVKFAIDSEITPIICVGETASEKENGQTTEVLKTQITSALSSIDPSQVILAYEPVWAISSTPGAQQATPEVIAQTLEIIKRIIADIGPEQPPILYGGSVNPDNIETYLALDDISGFLIGNASLDVDKMYAMIEATKGIA